MSIHKAMLMCFFSLRYAVLDTTRLTSGRNYTIEIVGTDDVGNTNANFTKWSWLSGMLNLLVFFHCHCALMYGWKDRVRNSDYFSF